MEEYFTQNSLRGYENPPLISNRATSQFGISLEIFEVECLLAPQSQPADEEEHGRPIGVRLLVPALTREC